jgi:hypothetical protein
VSQSTKHKVQSTNYSLKVAAIILGIIIASIGGVMACRALFLEPKSIIIRTTGEVQEAPNYTRVIGGTALFLGGAAIAVYSATRRRI